MPVNVKLRQQETQGERAERAGAQWTKMNLVGKGWSVAVCHPAQDIEDSAKEVVFGSRPPFAARSAETLLVSMVSEAYLSAVTDFIIALSALSAVCLYRRIALCFLSSFCFTCCVSLFGASNPNIHSSIAWGQMHKKKHSVGSRPEICICALRVRFTQQCSHVFMFFDSQTLLNYAHRM